MRTESVLRIAAVILLPLTIHAQVVRWAYRYNGPANRVDTASLITLGPDGHVYVAGTSQRSTYESPFVGSSRVCVGDFGARRRRDRLCWC